MTNSKLVYSTDRGRVCPTCGWYAGREAVVIEPVAPVEGQR